MAIAGLPSRDLFGILPSGLTELDLAFHAIVGLAAVSISSQATMHPGSTHRA